MDQKITLNDIGGYEYQKEEVKKIINFFKNYKTFKDAGAKLTRGILFYGSPGNGKTMFSNAITNECGVKVFRFDADEIADSDVNKTSKALSNIFKMARNNSPSIIVIEEIGQIIEGSVGFGRPSEEEKNNLRTLLCEIDKLEGYPVTVIATGNLELEEISDALIRDGRLEKHIEITAPDYSDRKSILDIYLSKNDLFSEINVKELAILTSGLTCASLRNLINDVLVKCISEKKEKAEYNDFFPPLQAILSHGSKRKSKTDKTAVIYHEIGHLIVDYALTGNYGFISTESYGKSEGRYKKILNLFSEEEENNLEENPTTFEEIYKIMLVSVAGLAATEIFYGKKMIGASSDLTKVERLYNYAGSNGLLGLKYIPFFFSQRNEPTSSLKKKLLGELYEKLYKQASEILSSNKEVVEEMFTKLKDKNTLSTNEVGEILRKYSINKPSLAIDK